MNAEQITHPGRKQLQAFLDGRLSGLEQQTMEEHVNDCETCCDVLREVSPDSLVRELRVAATWVSDGDTQTGVWRGPEPDDDGEVPHELAEHPRYRVLERLGAGGMGVVYKAEHRLMERMVALKVMSRRLVDSAPAVQRFRQEVKTAARLSHRNIVTAYDAEQAGDLHLLVMEFIEGNDLAAVVKRRGVLSLLHACNYVIQAAYGLQHAAEQGMVHRDIKPQNLMLSRGGTIKILDFGLARLAAGNENQRITKVGVALGTVDYIAPEQIEDASRVDVRADIYSLGCTLYYLLVGRPPFADGTPVDKLVAHLQRKAESLAAVRPETPLEVAGLIERMMSKDPDDRPQTAADVIEILSPFGKPRAPAELASSSADTDTAVPKQVAEAPTPPPAIGRPVVSPESETPPDGARRFGHVTNGGPMRRLSSPAFWMLIGGGTLGLAIIFVRWMSPDRADVQPAVIPRPLVQRSQSSAADNWLDLMPGIDPGSDAIDGTWHRSGDQLIVDATRGAKLWLPVEPPHEYDLEVEFTRINGVHSVALFFVVGDNQAAFDIDAWEQHLAGIQNVAGADLRERNDSAGMFWLENGQRYKALVQVRRGRVICTLDGRRLGDYEGDGGNLSTPPIWGLPKSTRLALGAWSSGTVFHSVRFRPISAF